MTVPTPLLDSRTYEDLVTRIEHLAKKHSAWRPAHGGQDPGSALIRVFARMLCQVIQRLNRVPELHRRAFLELLGTAPRPPRAARVPLTFQLAPGAPSATVPPGTRVSGEDSPAFETEQALTLTRSTLVALLVREPKDEKKPARHRLLDPASPQAFSPFEVQAPVERELYLACDALFTQPDTTHRALEIEWALSPKQEPAWSFWDGAQWRPLPLRQDVSPDKAVRTLDLTGVHPERLARWGRTARWLRCVPMDSWDTLVPRNIQTQVRVKRTGVLPDRLFHNALALEPDGNVLPFGEMPHFNDAFYLSSADVLRTAGPSATRTIHLTVGWNANSPWKHVSPEGVTAVLAWEVWTDKGWWKLGRSTKDGTDTEDFRDTTRALTQDGQVRLTLPGHLQDTRVNGVLGRWLRIRIVEGHYGAPETRATRPPVLSFLTLGYEDTLHPPWEACLSHDGGVWTHLPVIFPWAPGVTVFQEEPETHPTLYLGFDRPFGDLPVSLFFQVEPPSPEDLVAHAANASVGAGDERQLAWEYRHEDGWRSLAVEDETSALLQDGLVRFIGPSTHTQRLESGQKCFWLRVRRLSEGPVRSVKLRGVRLNTVWACHATLVTDEVLGSSTASAAQTFSTTRTPVLEDFRLDVLEETWVRWSAVPDLLASGPEDRHYTLDPARGQVRFGDGLRGRIPPAGANNVRLTYRSGGGASGDVPAGTLTRLVTPLPSVASVSQPEPATGGADGESPPQLAWRQARVLRHGGRAVTAEDYEDLAREASTTIARVRACPPAFNPIAQAEKPAPQEAGAGRVSLIVIPHGAAPRPLPDLQLLRRVEEHLRARCPPTTVLHVTGPTWIAAAFTAVLVPRRVAEGEAVRTRARDRLARYLHPLTGGPTGAGWDFDQRPRESELLALIHQEKGVDHVLSAELTLSFGPAVPGSKSLFFVEEAFLDVRLAGIPE
ncbi:putative baseplate assembly protein [Archangium primigenium]|uniref:putative baseplate assembly protein n=1 Tax=[Archangium] primigenium TaxID=2792470 RepID=UPI00195E6C27|nr:putative baseplate assembly protein [Archangium primigenium]MBM7116696.1 putative baseplate assembly protein [Archangium primigenium]